MNNMELISSFLQRPLLVITDKSKTNGFYDHRNTMFLCLDRETTRELEAAGCTVYGFTSDELIGEWYDIYNKYDFGYTPPAWVADVDVEMLYEQLAMRTVEFYAPILYVWDLVISAISCNPTARIVIDVDNKWLRVILEELLDQQGAQS